MHVRKLKLLLSQDIDGGGHWPGLTNTKAGRKALELCHLTWNENDKRAEEKSRNTAPSSTEPSFWEEFGHRAPRSCSWKAWRSASLHPAWSVRCDEEKKTVDPDMQQCESTSWVWASLATSIHQSGNALLCAWVCMVWTAYLWAPWPSISPDWCAPPQSMWL